MVIDTGRTRELPKIIDELARLAAEQREHELAEIRTAVPLDRRAARPPRGGVVPRHRTSGRRQGRRRPLGPRRRGRARRRPRLRRLDREPPRRRQTRTRRLRHMALNLDPASIADALRKNVESWTPSVEREEVGRVIETGDGIARVAGLPRTMANELLEFPGGLLGVAFNLDEARDRLHHLRRRRRHRGGRRGQADRPHPLGPGRRRVPRPGGRRPRPSARRQGRDRGRGRARRSSCRRPTSSRASR